MPDFIRARFTQKFESNIFCNHFLKTMKSHQEYITYCTQYFYWTLNFFLRLWHFLKYFRVSRFWFFEFVKHSQQFFLTLSCSKYIQQSFRNSHENVCKTWKFFKRNLKGWQFKFWILASWDWSRVGHENKERETERKKERKKERNILVCCFQRKKKL